jgi:hypothetical protein
MRGLLRARRLFFNSLQARYIHTENDIYKPSKGGTIPTMVGELICAMMEGKPRTAEHTITLLLQRDTSR